jgi:prophage antirepressor-like protein
MADSDPSPVRTVLADGEPWFVAQDICDVLGITKVFHHLDRLTDSMKGLHTMHTLGGTQSMPIVSEAGMYKLVFSSRRPQADMFTNWVTSEVLPSIRKTGSSGISWDFGTGRLLPSDEPSGATTARTGPSPRREAISPHAAIVGHRRFHDS